jgi:hypothetical protein
MVIMVSWMMGTVVGHDDLLIIRAVVMTGADLTLIMVAYV